jgi:VIT1/CCC1 family predicted Fe2+/Mn2+ transporter
MESPLATQETEHVHEHPDVTGGWLRPAVFGAMDGLVSNAALIAGVAGGTRDAADASVIVLAGLAGLAAGAFSMAAGEYASVASQSEAAELEIAKERQEIIDNPAKETAELAEMFAEKGIELEVAREMAEQVHRDLDNAVTVHSKEEFGVDPGDLASPMLAAVSSFIAFAVGAFVPVVPYLFGSEMLAPAIVLTLVALFGCGAVVTRLTSRPWWFGGLRQVLLGGAAFTLTYVVGMAVGAGLA